MRWVRDSQLSGAVRERRARKTPDEAGQTAPAHARQLTLDRTLIVGTLSTDHIAQQCALTPDQAARHWGATLVDEGVEEFRLLIAPPPGGSVATVELLQSLRALSIHVLSHRPCWRDSRSVQGFARCSARRSALARATGPVVRAARRAAAAVLGAVAAFCLGMSFAGTGTTYATLSDFGSVKGSARAGVWAPDPPEICTEVLHAKMSTTHYGTLGDDLLGISNAPGGNHPQVLMGYDGNDTLAGANQADCLVGGPGNDHLTGGNGKDILDGGGGWDVCEGDNGQDTFVSCEQVVAPTAPKKAPVLPVPAGTPEAPPATTPPPPPSTSEPDVPAPDVPNPTCRLPTCPSPSRPLLR